LAAINELEQTEIKTRRIEVQGDRSLAENLADLRLVATGELCAPVKAKQMFNMFL